MNTYKKELFNQISYDRLWKRMEAGKYKLKLTESDYKEMEKYYENKVK